MRGGVEKAGLFGSLQEQDPVRSLPVRESKGLCHDSEQWPFKVPFLSNVVFMSFLEFNFSYVDQRMI